MGLEVQGLSVGQRGLERASVSLQLGGGEEEEGPGLGKGMQG